MDIYRLDGAGPIFADPARAYVAPGASVIGQVKIGMDVSIWFGAVLRGDNALIEIGDASNIQDGAVVHVDPGMPVSIGAGCTIGHRAIVHGATIGPNSLIGMGATILNGVRIGANCLVGANALLTENKSFPDGWLIIGSPAKAVRELLPAEIESLRRSAETYVENGRRFAVGLSRTAS